MQTGWIAVQLMGVLAKLLLLLMGVAMNLWELLSVPDLSVPQTAHHLSNSLRYKPTPLSAMGKSDMALAVRWLDCCSDQGYLHW